ncbi:MAG: hypothetical protein ACYDDW_14655 [Dermatophilaceae bacterium]
MAKSWHDGKRFGSVRRLWFGRFQARYTLEAADHRAPRTFARVRSPRTFATQGEADTWLRIRHAELDTGTRLLAKPKRAGVTLPDYATAWLRERDRKPRTRVLKPRARVLYGRQLDLYLLPTFGKRSLTSITRRRYASGTPTSTETRQPRALTPTRCSRRS